MTDEPKTALDIECLRRALAPRGPVPELRRGERYASVAAVLRQAEPGLQVLLIRRAHVEGDPWSGHMAFPGGRHDASDPDLLFTAVRETREEIGLDLQKGAEFLGRLELVPAIARGRRIGLTIAPFVFQVSNDPPLVLNREVVETLWAPLSQLAQGQNATVVRYELEGQALELPAWDVSGRVVWGLTYRMLGALVEDLRVPRRSADHTPG